MAGLKKDFLKLDREKWNRLSQEEKEIMMKLGFSPKKKEATVPHQAKYTKGKEMQEYILCVRVNCSLCKCKSYELFHMQQTKEGLKGEFSYHAQPEWTSKEIPYSVEMRIDRIQGVERGYCSHCKKTLLTWSKEDLVTELLKTAKHLYSALRR